MISGVEAETKASCFMPRFLVYHSLVASIDSTVRTRWSRDWIVAAGLGVDDVILYLCSIFQMVHELRNRLLMDGKVGWLWVPN